MLKLKVVIPVIDDDTFRVNIADVELFAANVEPSLFQVKLIYELAFAGVQFELVKLNVTGMVPVFLMYTV